MDPFYGLMTSEIPEEEQLRMLAQQLRGASATGGQLSTSTIEPVSAQGAAMQTNANEQAAGIGLQNFRKKQLAEMARSNDEDRKLRLLETTARMKIAGMKAAGKAAKSGTGQDVFNKLTSSERTKAMEQAMLDNSEVSLIEGWTPDVQQPVVGGITGWLGNKGIPLTDDAERMTNYWKEYSNWENRVRNSIFGSALTGFEIKAWEKANVNASMQPELVRERMGVRRSVMEKKAAEQADIMRDYGWPEPTLQKLFKILPPEAWQDLQGFAAQKDQYFKDYVNAEGAGEDDLANTSDEDLLRMLGGQ
jgi:hypothetical protein